MKFLPARRLAALPALACFLFSIPDIGLAADESGALACPEPAIAAMITRAPDRETAPITMRAEKLDAELEKYGEAVGQVEIFRADQYLSTDYLRYEPQTRTARIPGPMFYEDIQIRLEASSATFMFLENSGEFEEVKYSLVGSSANGVASEVVIENGRRSYLQDIAFTTCPGDRPEWQLSARELELRHDEGTAIARGAKLRMLGVPVLYLPWISFPIDDRRKSGFLYPHFSKASDNGFEVGIPYYWNIAPNQDATITPRYLTDRGFMLTNEYRFITQATGGQLDFHFLPDDKIAGRNRYHHRTQFDVGFNPQWHGGLDFERVSDNQYFQDFGGNLAQTSRQYLHSEAGIDGGGRYWIFSMTADDFQVIDDNVNQRREPYRRVPRLAFQLDAPLGRQGLQIDLDSELVYFDRSTGVTGARLDLYPALVWNENPFWGFFRISAGYRQTSYNLDLGTKSGDESPQRGLPILSLDSGMYFDRSLSNGNRQTLEPRFFYLYVPYENQDNLPDFDTGDFTFGFAQLFHTNRFTGADRQTDANQVTLAATTRSISSSSGREVWNLSVGQIFYLEEPRVMLADEEPQSLDTSPFIAEYNWHPLDRFSARLGIQWNWEQGQVDVIGLGFAHTAKSGNRLGFDYRFRRDRLDQLDIRYDWPINENWRVFSRLNYSFQESDLLEALAGFEYESCCWAIRIAGRQYLKDRAGGKREAIYVEFRLKGLGAIGRRNDPMFYDYSY